MPNPLIFCDTVIFSVALQKPVVKRATQINEDLPLNLCCVRVVNNYAEIVSVQGQVGGYADILELYCACLRGS